MVRRLVPTVVAAALATAGLVSCDEPSVADVVAAEVVAAQDGPVDTPPRDAHLVEAGWPEAAAWIAREARQGRPVVVNVFASWCAPCRDEMPLLRAAARDHPGIAFLGIDHRDRREDGEAFIVEEQVPFPTLFDIGGDVAMGVRSTGMPTTAFFDHTGRLVRVHVGIVTEQLLEEQLADLAAAAAAAADA